ncbi:MAG: DEAD/DEAH box helicase [Polyangiaceae bacterium]|jgi:ATP-dependent RNA helicase DeaD
MTERNVLPAESGPTEVTFDVLPLGADVRRAIDAMGYRHPTPVQLAVFEPAVEGRNLVVQARTGTGKTAAFGLPIVDRVVRPATKAVQALVLCPTRELALQVSREVEQLGQFRGIKVVPVYGGASITKQIEAIESGGHIVVGTPGRVLDHLRQKTLDPSGIRALVLDEADEMLSMGFARELNAIIETLPKNRQGMFFSATLPPDIERLAHNHLRDAELITLSSDQVGALQIAHYVYVMREGDKIGQLVRVLEVEDPESAIVFCNTRDETLRVAEALKARGFDADWLNGDLPQNDRERVMSATREGRLRFLVATDVAARGIDISHLTHVINHDFPETAEQYVHRTGRTGRAGRTGTAISIVGPKDIGNLYLLRLTYKIRPLEKQLPSAGELKTRAEMDVVQLFVDAFTNRAVHPDDLSLARRMFTHDDGERIVAGLLRDHLGARGGDASTEAAEARRARNPVVRRPDPSATPIGEVGREPVAARQSGGSPLQSDPSLAAPSSAKPPDRSKRGWEAQARSSPRSRTPVASEVEVTNFRWQPPKEADDDDPILDVPVAADPASAALPAPPAPRDEAPRVEAARIEAPRDEASREEDGAANASNLAPGEAFVQVFVNVGTREGVRAHDLQQLLSERGVASSDLGGVRVRDRMSFVRVRRGAFDRAVAALSGQVIAGRTVVAELARGRV